MLRTIVLDGLHAKSFVVVDVNLSYLGFIASCMNSGIVIMDLHETSFQSPHCCQSVTRGCPSLLSLFRW